ncbi:Leg1-related protein [Amycolatopsis sp. CA-128772]|uniref:Leg1-related protein n=1 Tax=Amycolatopsis sp. CA-128772 TaxID=2073159 RepID=UPI000CCFFE83|nr:Leg1-related protein [Amycolatopsis sp. CA-128772]
MTSIHPRELADLDLYAVWVSAAELTDRFDPFRFEHRMAAYRRLIDATNSGGLFGADNRHNPLWAWAFQLQWQCRTGRLGATTHVDGTIDPDAPWAYGNYTLSVVPWLGAEKAGVVAPLEIADAPGAARFRYVRGGAVPDELAPSVEQWRRYFAMVTGTPATTDLEPLRVALWKAHKTCLDVVVTKIADIDPAPCSPLELTFLRGWCRMVDYLGAAAWRTDFGFMTEHGLDVLPEILLEQRSDLRTLPDRVRRNVANVIRLATTSPRRYALNLWLWRRIMRTRAARDEVLILLDALFAPRRDNAAARRRMLGHLLRP